MSQWISTNSTAPARPTDGRGNADVTAVSTFAPATIFRGPGALPITAGAIPVGTFVASAIANTILAAWGGGARVPAVGDVIFDNQGGVLIAWGIITKLTASAFAAGGTTYDAISVDRWRKPGVLESNVEPADGDDLGLFPRMYGELSEKWVLDWILVQSNSAAAAATVTVVDLAGNAIPGLTIGVLPTAAFFPNMLTFASMEEVNGTTAFEINMPVMIKVSAATTQVCMGFRALARE